MKKIPLLCLILMQSIFCASDATFADGAPPILKDSRDAPLDAEDQINLQCLRDFYPIEDLLSLPNGEKWLRLKNGAKILYDYGNAQRQEPGLAGTVKESMASHYPLEPERPPTPAGFAPGRIRAYDLLQAVYGRNAREVQKKLTPVKFQSKTLRMADNAAQAFAGIKNSLDELAARDSSLKGYLLPEGAYYWRKIAGEKHLSAHSYGIALDLGIKKSPYWRWSKQRPHPAQATYPTEIVSLFESAGFIWGGKWHEYDLMHFEYRPEIICKAKHLRQKRR